MSEKKLSEHVHDFILRRASPPPVVLESWMDQAEALERIHWALEAAGRLACACETALRSGPLDLSDNLKRVNDALLEYDDRIVTLAEKEMG
jgi:hypothetical protein